MPQSERHALVVGGGTMGVGIIAMFLGHGWKVDVVSRSAVERATACPRRAAARSPPWASLPIRQGSRPMPRCRKRRGPTIDIVVETVTEDLALKQKLFAEMEALARPDCRDHLELLELPDQPDRQGPEDARAA